MEQELGVFDRGERPDCEVFGAIIEFFKMYPDSCHHPKEDIIYEKFKARDPGRAASIADLQAEHREGAVRLRRVAQAIDSVLNDQELLRESVDRIVRDFIDNERKHIVLEDEVIFPVILDTLQPPDWADIALTLADRYGPPSETDFEEQFSTLRRNILELDWVNPGTSKSDFAEDQNACMRELQEPPSSGVTNQQMYEACMHTHGWELR
jgi:hemerythrin-like domain-containing protein